MNNLQDYQPSFIEYLFKTKRNKVNILICFCVIIIEFGIFKYFYPRAGFIHGDSFNYLTSAYQNLDVNAYMIGYAKFLRLFSVFSSWDFSLVAVQYLFIHIAALFLLFTVFYFYKPSKLVQTLLLSFFVLNPLFLYMANYVSSDALFLALSLTWFSLLIWIINRPTRSLIIWHALFLFLSFTVRYNALIYPVIAVMAFAISPLSLRKKISGIGLSLVFIAAFVLYTSNRYKHITGYWQYSPFSGWQLANNAMYAYRYVDSVDRKPVPKKFDLLDKMIRNYFDSSRDIRLHPAEAMQASTVYMWDKELSPLYKYREFVFEKDSSASELKKWASMGPLYKEYGLCIIKKYPVYFLKYFLWPNSAKYYAPPTEFLAFFNSGKDSTATIGRVWFNYKTNYLNVRVKDRNVQILDFYPILSGIENSIMLLILVFFLMLKGAGSSTSFKKAILLGSMMWFINAVFTIGASSAALRFQASPVIFAFLFSILLVEWLYNVAFGKKIEFKTETGDCKENPSILDKISVS